jgi:ankyrin repeat protein
VCPGDSCKYKAALCADLLLEAGAWINLPNSNGDVPLYLAVKNDWHKCAMILLHRDADTTIKYDQCDDLPTYNNNKYSSRLISYKIDLLFKLQERWLLKCTQVTIVVKINVRKLCD